MSTLDEALAALRRGEAIGLPTETVYGLAADASNPDAVRRIFALKGRPADHPLIVHVAGVAALADLLQPLPAWQPGIGLHFGLYRVRAEVRRDRRCGELPRLQPQRRHGAPGRFQRLEQHAAVDHLFQHRGHEQER